ncbi:O-antigen acetylase [Stenotrophomonas maltophilia AU12-09]|uniref:acyltransferase family protein n=1 Tax=Stenotrophomonas maltophilia TaxID=40324 RepID=UPI0002BFDD7F|nr:acyltransferase family protein [Stenotrophomonas maltophilia]EMI49437.1 O-antigen acetylase [Stenotrophomonas maltophilia AU12-09]
MTADPSRGYVPHIDGLRAIAVLAVIVFHLDPAWLPGGFTGVDVFFVISGFVVSASVHRLPPLSLGQSMLRFYARRIRRIAPALLACVLLTAVASVLFIPESWLSEASDKTGLMALFGFSNWVLAAIGNDYFAPKAEFNPYTHTWSLGVEEQFYLLFPLLFLAWARGARGRWLSVGLFALVSVASLLHAAVLGLREAPPSWAFYATTTRLWQLGAGVLLFQLLHVRASLDPLTQRSLARSRWVFSLLAALSLALLGWALWTARAGHSPWPDGLLPAFATAGLLWALHNHPQAWIGRVLACAPMRRIGLLSYSLYLWHWPVFVLMRWTVGLDTPLQMLLAMLLVGVLSWLSWRWVEQPFRGPLAPRATSLRWVVMGALVLVGAGGIQFGLYREAHWISLSTVTRHPADWYPEGRGAAADYPGCELVAGKHPFAGGNARSFARRACDHARVEGFPQRIFVAGDSHAMAYTELLRRVALETGATVILYGRGGCPQVSLQRWRGAGGGCSDYDAAVRADIQHQARAGDAVVLVSLRMPRLSDQYILFDAAEKLADERSPRAAELRSAEVPEEIALWKPVAEQGVRIVLEAPKPVLPAPPYRCSDTFNARNAICRNGVDSTRADMDALRAPMLGGLQQVVDGLPGAVMWDPLPVLCDATLCPAQRDGRPLYFDGDHLSGYGNRVLLPSLLQVLRQH